MVPSGKPPAASQDVSDGRSACSGVSNGRSHLNPYARPRRHFSHILPVFGGPAMIILILTRLPGSSSYLIPELLEHVTKRGVGDRLQFRRKGRLPPPERRRNITAGQVT